MTLSGKSIILLIRNLEKEKTESAHYILFQTEYEKTISTEVEETITKTGTEKSSSPTSTEITTTALSKEDDKVLDELEDGMHTGEKYGFWEINKEVTNEEGKYKSIYFEGTITNFQYTANAEESVEVSMDLSITGQGQRGFATLSEEQKDFVQYAFKDTTPLGDSESL
ncbi:phage major tail protein, TP901-1 family [Ignavigranum ruoffiae]|uniref:phage major tail protein, TP901-1 family n=1 Tax=Ignavigranum ruoffiae TaxID=89093 RepID=UPI00235520B4|nr:phage major tail protein, TP901-1 family [Ignavigranum ruoffiae]